MERVRKFFDEFKSIFTTDNVLKENERHANIVTATTMLNLFLIIFISWLLSRNHILEENAISIAHVVTNSFIGLFIPAVICFAFRGDKKWIKYMLIGMFILILGTIDSHLSYTTAFLMVLPVILSARYYRKDFTILSAVITFITFVVAAYVSGVNYLLNLQQIISALLLYYVVVFASVQMAQSGKNMITKQKEITANGTRIETELNLASSIQKSMLPSVFPPFPEHEEIDIYASMDPAREVGGDFYDMFLIDDRHLVINIADVSGKGIPASLVMMISTILIKNIARIEKSVDQIFNRVNKIICEGNAQEIFITSWLGILDLETGKLSFVNAGHNPPLIYYAKNNEYRYLKTNPNIVMGCIGDAKYEKHEITIEPDDKIFLYTDGVVEATNTENELYGEERLKEFLDKHIDLNAKETIEALEKELNKFVGDAPQFDDITMLQLNYNGKKIKKTFKADVAEWPLVEKFISNELKKHECSDKIINQIILVSEEIFVNIAKYAYKKHDGECQITIKLDEKTFICSFEDSGIPFNPLEENEPDINAIVAERQVGGLGIYITKHIVDDVQYEYKNDKNILTLKKKI